jgi:drug/metabolite transporter (DMT)-like permease
VLLPKLGAVNNAAVLNFEPIAVLGLAWVVLGQAVALLQILGAFIVVGSIAWMGAGKR